MFFIFDKSAMIHNSGQMSGFWFTGLSIYTTIILVANWKIYWISYNISIIQLFAIMIPLAIYSVLIYF